MEDLISVWDGIVRAAKLQVGKKHLNRLYNTFTQLELSCDRESVQAPLQLNPEALTFKPRRDAVVALTMAYLMQKLMLIRDIWAHWTDILN